jgi:hypothetical protein
LGQESTDVFFFAYLPEIGQQNQVASVANPIRLLKGRLIVGDAEASELLSESDTGDTKKRV